MKRIKMGAQYSEADFDVILKTAETAAQIGIAVSIW